MKVQQLYKLTERYVIIENMLDSEYETREEIEKSLANIKEEFEEKVENVAKLVLSLKNNMISIQTEEERLARRRQAMQNNMDWLKNYLLTEMLSTKILKIKRDVLTVSVADNRPSVEIEDIELIPREYIAVIPEILQPDKRAIAEHFNSTGEIVPGTDIITGKKQTFFGSARRGIQGCPHPLPQ